MTNGCHPGEGHSGITIFFQFGRARAPEVIQADVTRHTLLASSVRNLQVRSGLQKLPDLPPAAGDGSFARPDISTKVSNIILSQLSKITRWKNNRVCGASVKCRLANTCAIFSRSIEQHAQRRNLNMGLVAKRNNPVRQC